MAILDGSRELGALVLALRARHADAPFDTGEIVRAVLEVTRPSPHGLGPHRYSRLYVEALVRSGYLERQGDSVYRLGARALEFCRAWEAERDREIAALSQGQSLPERPAPHEAEVDGATPSGFPPAPSEVHGAEPDLGAVTPAFLREVLAEAGVPPELLDAILETYRERGRLTMSEDGGRYRIALV